MKRCLHTFCEPVWRYRRQLLQQSISGEIAGWLFDRGSLTRSMQMACDGQFRVQVIDQQWQRPFMNERQRLGMAAQRLAWVRQVYLLCHDIPCVYARTIVPHTTLSGAERHLTVLGNRPLGAVLFADPRMRRDEMEFARLQPGERLFADATHAIDEEPDVIWGRRSVFYLADKPLLVNEIFLPAIARI